MPKCLAVLAALALAAPALGDDAAMSDAELAGVAGGTGSLAPVTNLNLNVSPIILTQTAVAVNTQTQNATLGARGAAKGHGNGHAYGLAKQSQAGFAAAGNTAFINYHVVQVNHGG